MIGADRRRQFGAGPNRPAPPRSRRRDAGAGEAGNPGVASPRDDHAPLDWLAGSPLIAWCGGHGADHGHGVIAETVTSAGPLLIRR